MRKRKSGFTLIEVLVVVAIIALLISILLPSLSAARAQARSSVCMSNLHQAAIAMAAYASQNRDYIPRGGGVARYWGDNFEHPNMHWTIVLARSIGMNTRTIFEQAQAQGVDNINVVGPDNVSRPTSKRGYKLKELLWKAYVQQPIFQCPERAADSSMPESVSYAVNAFAKDAYLTDVWVDVSKPFRLSEWKFPARTIYLTDLEKSSVSGFLAKVCSWYTEGGTTWGDLGFLDASHWRHLPCYKVADQDFSRRIARFMHSKRRVNASFADGHAEAVDSLPRAEEVIPANIDYNQTHAYTQRWLRMMGVDVP